VTVTYRAAAGDDAPSLRQTAGTIPDLAVLSLPTDAQAMKTMARDGSLQSLDFAAPSVAANYAFSWKQLGSVDRRLTGLPVAATDRSAFWYDKKAFAALGLTAPASVREFEQTAATIKAHGLAPFAISGASRKALPNLFQNLYLALQGNQRYDRLLGGALKWNDGSVATTLRAFKRIFGTGIAGGTASLKAPYSAAVKAVFGSPMKAYAVPGGTDVLPVLHESTGVVRPLSQFATFAFPRVNSKLPPRVIGDASVVVMTRDTPAARALVRYLASPDAAEVWAKQGTDFLSPNRKVPATAYSEPALGGLAQSLSAANVFRFAIADVQGAKVRQVMSLQLARYLEGTDTAGDVMSRLMIAAGQS
jgi:ABC-type glycerol-3-phosphate transport system substrate-binding protein